MNSISTLIVEDEILIAETIKLYLAERNHTVTDIAISFEEAQASIEKNKPDVVLLDVRLYGEKSGIDFANYLIENHKDTPFIFLTSQFDQRIVENAMITNPEGYLTKPIQKESLWTTTELAHFKFAKTSSTSPKIHLFDGSKSHIIEEDSIAYIKSDHVYINIYTSDEEVIVIRQSLQQIISSLNADKFVQCHRGHIVNVSHVSKYNTQELVVLDTSIPLSRSRRDDVINRLKINI